MNIKILSLQKHREPSLAELEGEYIKRLSKFCKVSLESIRRAKINDSLGKDEILKKEAKGIREKLKSKDFLIALDSQGKQCDSEELSRKIKGWQMEGTQTLVFLIGGPLGLADDLKKEANFVLSLSRLTFGHEIARMLLTETLYRSFDILNGGNYHK